MPHQIDARESDGATTIVVGGEIDLYSSPDLRAALAAAIAGNAATVAVDLAKVAYMDSSGVATLVEALRSAGKEDTQLVILAPSQSVLKVLQLSRLDAIFDIRPSL
jgi:anti-sigma B factor antagonist